MLIDRRDAERYARRFERLIIEMIRGGKRYASPGGGPPRSQLFLMGVLRERGPQRISDLSQALDVTSPAITGLVDELVSAGYARRIPDPHDRRVIRVALTEAGSATYERVRAERLARTVALLEHCEVEEIEAFLKTLTKIHGLLRDIAPNKG
ncbi:MAG TPA: MarR family transcriptional regulator [Limnochordia bacterium]